jgi:hypothetical protein
MFNINQFKLMVFICELSAGSIALPFSPIKLGIQAPKFRKTLM